MENQLLFVRGNNLLLCQHTAIKGTSKHFVSHIFNPSVTFFDNLLMYDLTYICLSEIIKSDFHNLRLLNL